MARLVQAVTRSGAAMVWMRQKRATAHHPSPIEPVPRPTRILRRGSGIESWIEKIGTKLKQVPVHVVEPECVGPFLTNWVKAYREPGIIGKVGVGVPATPTADSARS